jgi:hypothetical protein
VHFQIGVLHLVCFAHPLVIRAMLRYPSGGREAGTRCGRPTYPIPTLPLRNQTRDGWSSMVITTTSLVGSPTSTLVPTSTSHTLLRFEIKLSLLICHTYGCLLSLMRSLLFNVYGATWSSFQTVSSTMEEMSGMCLI